MQTEAKPTGLGTLGAIGAGAALMYLLDPDRGARRRKLVADKLVRFGHTTTDALDTTRRDLGNRTRGAVAAARSRGRPDEVAGRDASVESREQTR